MKRQIFWRLSGIASVLGFLLVGVLLAYYLEINFCVKALTPMAYAKTRSEKEAGNDSRQVGQACSWLVGRNRWPRVAGEETVPAPQLAPKTGRRSGGPIRRAGVPGAREGGRSPKGTKNEGSSGDVEEKKKGQVPGVRCQVSGPISTGPLPV